MQQSQSNLKKLHVCMNNCLILLLTLGLTLASTVDDFDSNVILTYGSLMRLRSPSSNLWVHSHEMKFGMNGVMSVTGYAADDLGNYWQIQQQYQSLLKTYSDHVRCGDIVMIRSTIADYFLRLEETQYGLTTNDMAMVHGIKPAFIDEKINWKIICSEKHEGESVHYNDFIRVKHQVTGKYVSLDPVYAYTEANCGRGCVIAGQTELHGLDFLDETTSVFQVKTGISFDQQFVTQQQG